MGLGASHYCTQESPRKVIRRAHPCVPVAAILKQWVWGGAGSECSLTLVHTVQVHPVLSCVWFPASVASLCLLLKVPNLSSHLRPVRSEQGLLSWEGAPDTPRSHDPCSISTPWGRSTPGRPLSSTVDSLKLFKEVRQAVGFLIHPSSTHTSA